MKVGWDLSLTFVSVVHKLRNAMERGLLLKTLGCVMVFRSEKFDKPAENTTFRGESRPFLSEKSTSQAQLQKLFYGCVYVREVWLSQRHEWFCDGCLERKINVTLFMDNP